ncbi:DUF937 domain-containing protein [Methylobacterium sp.]|uniref:DUF937 domain-containing protein n=1 Tax=Methylobacterium sp. TaxID=409 RepID=UPI0025DF4D61|nr:DUF937 domain-containing protein [Methylobacterium sp.]
MSPFVREAAMFNLFDILQAQAGANLQGFGPQFGLTQEQGLRAMEALLPALTMGLQRNAAQDPMGFAKMFNLVAPTPPTKAKPFFQMDKPSQQMDMLVGQLFGSPHLSQAVLQQAAAVSGVATPALKQMLPLMAGMVVAGIVHVMINQAPAPAPQSPAQTFGFPPNVWSQMMESFLSSGGSAAPAAQSTPARKPPAPPRLAAAASPKTARSSQGGSQETSPGDAPFEMMQQMFQTGLEVQQENARAMQRLFDTFWQGAGGADTERSDAPAPGGGRSKTEAGRGGR